MATASLITRNVSPTLFSWADEAQFLGSLDGEELWVTERGEYLRQVGAEEHQYGTLGCMAPAGTPYAFAKALAGRAKARGARYVPNAYRTG